MPSQEPDSSVLPPQSALMTPPAEHLANIGLDNTEKEPAHCTEPAPLTTPAQPPANLPALT